MRTPDTHIMFQPSHYTQTDYSITTDPGDEAEMESLKHILGGGYLRRKGEVPATQETGLGETGTFSVIFTHPRSDNQQRIGKQLQIMGYTSRSNLPINPSLRYSY